MTVQAETAWGDALFSHFLFDPQMCPEMFSSTHNKKLTLTHPVTAETQKFFTLQPNKRSHQHANQQKKKASLHPTNWFCLVFAHERSELRPSSADHSHSSSLPYRVQRLLESPGHAWDQVYVVVHAAPHAALHQRANSRLFGSRVEQILCLVIAVHRASGQTILGAEERREGFKYDEDTSSRRGILHSGKNCRFRKILEQLLESRALLFTLC